MIRRRSDCGLECYETQSRTISDPSSGREGRFPWDMLFWVEILALAVFHRLKELMATYGLHALVGMFRERGDHRSVKNI